MQRVVLDRGLLFLPPRTASSCLGADDTAGVFLMTEMIARNVPGRYVFHFGEERGCVGSEALVRENPAWLADIKIAIALDRKGTQDVITHQGGRTCSDDFARDLAQGIGMGYAPSDQGIYTDTERYASVVPECTNVSVGYEGAHTSREYLDARHVIALLARLCALDARVLGVYRDPLADAWGWDDEDVYTTFDKGQYLDPDYAALARYMAEERETESEREARNARDITAWFKNISKGRL